MRVRAGDMCSHPYVIYGSPGAGAHRPTVSYSNRDLSRPSVASGLAPGSHNGLVGTPTGAPHEANSCVSMDNLYLAPIYRRMLVLCGCFAGVRAGAAVQLEPEAA